jgi:hypothetical protein
MEEEPTGEGVKRRAAVACIPPTDARRRRRPGWETRCCPGVASRAPMDARRISRPGRWARRRTAMVSSRRLPAAVSWGKDRRLAVREGGRGAARPWRPVVGSLRRRDGTKVGD